MKLRTFNIHSSWNTQTGWNFSYKNYRSWQVAERFVVAKLVYNRKTKTRWFKDHEYFLSIDGVMKYLHSKMRKNILHQLTI